MKRIITAAACALLLAGCASTTPATTDDTAALASAASAAAESLASGVYETVATEDAEAESDDESSTFTFGDTMTYENGVAVTVSKPRTFQRDEYAAGGEDAEHAVKFKVTIVNGSDDPLDLALFNASMQSGDTEADQIYQDDLDGAPSTKLRPGRTSTFWIGFGVDDPDDLVLDVAPNWDYNTMTFVS